MLSKVHIRVLGLLFILLLGGVHSVYAQLTANVDDITTLSVQNVPGETYVWELYDTTVVNFATIPGNCPNTKAVFMNGNTGASVDVKWLKKGVYFYKIIVQGAGGCSNNIKIGKIRIRNPLPIELYSFTANAQSDGTVLLEWKSAVEINNDYYTVYKSKDGLTWEMWENVKGAGNSTVEQVYQLIDDEPNSPITYYRLSQTDFDRTTNELGIRYVEMSGAIQKEFEPLLAYPNPTTGKITIRGKYKDLRSLKVVNLLGVNLVSEVHLTVVSEQEIRLDLSAVPVGVYLIHIDDEIIKVVKQ